MSVKDPWCSEATGIELHQQERMYQSLRNWVEDNPVYNRLIDWKMRLDESESVFARVTRVVTNAVGAVAGIIELIWMEMRSLPLQAPRIRCRVR